MLRLAQTNLAAVFLSVAGALIPVSALAITVATFVSQQDQSLQAKELEHAINQVVNSSQTPLRSPRDKNGNLKSEEQWRQDRELADRILNILNNIDQDKLALMLVNASRQEPNVQLEDVIKAYIVQELKQPQTSGKPASPK